MSLFNANGANTSNPIHWHFKAVVGMEILKGLHC